VFSVHYMYQKIFMSNDKKKKKGPRQ